MMATLKGDPLFAELQSMTEDIDRALGRMLATQGGNGGSGWLPPADILETEDDVVIQLDVPGCQSEDLSVEAVDGQLVVAGERRPAYEGVTRRFRAERWGGKFVRSFTLAPTMPTDDIRADYHDGVLTIRLSKPEESKPRRISISRERRQIEKKN